jgi:antitoxin component YwqK of YwqJK toxin-antitoxin module
MSDVKKKLFKKLPLTESEESKKGKLFIPRRLSGENSRFIQWNKEQPIVDGERINQFTLNGKKEGLWVEFEKNKITSRIEYKNGLWGGVYQTFYLNGQIQYDGQTKDGELDGLWKMYYRNGNLKEIGSHVDGKPVGIWKTYYPFNNQFENNNLLSSIGNYINGKVDGLWVDYFMNGKVSSKSIYNMAKRIAYISYNKDGGVSNSINWKDEYDNMVIKEQMEDKDNILKSWGNYYGSDDTANWELESYESEVEDLIENGGNIYRVLFVDNLSEVNLKDMGNHWTTSRNNVIDVAEINQQYYGKNKQKVIVIEGYVEPNSITIEGVDVKGNPHEKEVNIKEGKGVKIKQIFEYVGRKFIPIDMNINEQMEDKDNILKSFEPKKELNPKVWDEDDKLKKKIKDTLVAIGQEFHKTLEVEAPIDDIIFTGSLANYNWSQYSDVDLHVLMDFNEFDDKELIKKYFDAKKAVWNDNHDIKIKGYDVELYAQDKDEPHESTGIYSVMKDEWVKKPKPQDVKIDRETIKKKVKQFEGEYNRILKLYKEEKYEETRKALDKLKDKIKKYRKAGLDKGGEMATENLVFKTMRRSGLIEKIYKLGLETTDKEYTIETIDESEHSKKGKLFIPRRIDERLKEWNEMQPIIDGKKINQYDLTTRNMIGRWGEGDINAGNTINLFVTYWDVFNDSEEFDFSDSDNMQNIYDNMILRIKDNFPGDISEYGPLDLMYFDLTIPLKGKEVWEEFKKLYNEELPLTKNINEGKINDNIDDILKNFKKTFGLDIGFLMTFGGGINALIRNLTSLIKQYTVQPLNSFELTNLVIAMIVVYLRKNKSLKDFKNEMLSITAFATLIPAYSDLINSLLGNVDFMEAFMTIIKSAGVYTMLSHFKSK